MNDGLDIPLVRRNDVARKKRKSRSPHERPRRAIMNLQETARYLKVSPATIKELIETRSFPYRRVGDRLYFGRRAIIRWFNGSD